MSNRSAVATLITTDGHTIILIHVRQSVGSRWEIHMDGQKINTTDLNTLSEAKQVFADAIQQWADE